MEEKFLSLVRTVAANTDARALPRLWDLEMDKSKIMINQEVDMEERFFICISLCETKTV